MIFQGKINNPVGIEEDISTDTSMTHFPRNTTNIAMNQGRCSGWHVRPETNITPNKITIAPPPPHLDHVADWHANAPLPELTTVDDYQAAEAPSAEDTALLQTGKSDVNNQPHYIIQPAIWGGCYYYQHDEKGYSLHIPFDHKQPQTF